MSNYKSVRLTRGSAFARKRNVNATTPTPTNGARAKGTVMQVTTDLADIARLGHQGRRPK